MEYKEGVCNHLVSETIKRVCTFNLNLNLVGGILGNPKVRILSIRYYRGCCADNCV